jgi:hypothetical protein
MAVAATGPRPSLSVDQAAKVNAGILNIAAGVTQLLVVPCVRMVGVSRRLRRDVSDGGKDIRSSDAGSGGLNTTG